MVSAALSDLLTSDPTELLRQLSDLAEVDSSTVDALGTVITLLDEVLNCAIDKRHRTRVYPLNDVENMMAEAEQLDDRKLLIAGKWGF